MSKETYSQEELNRYFSDRTARHGRGNGAERRRGRGTRRPEKGLRSFFYRRFDDPKKAQAAYALSLIAAFLLFCITALGLYMVVLSDDLPPFSALDNPDLQLATVAYTSDGRELARYAYQNRSWATYEEISPHAINALVAIEDKRFYDHWGLDLFRTVSAVAQTVLDKIGIPGFRTQGGSTISQQLARNLYNQEIGFKVNPTRKLKEMITAVQLERRYTKREIIEMYLNTVEFSENAFGIEAAGKTFFGKSASELDALESATLVGLLNAITFFNPIRNPENSRRRRNVVLTEMVERGYLTREFYETHKDDPVKTDYNPSEITASLAPYFAEYVRLWTRDWARENGFNIYSDGLIVYTTLDSRLQELARKAVEEQMVGLQAVVDFEWSRPSNFYLGQSTDLYLRQQNYEPFAHFWRSRRDLVDAFIRETEHYRGLRREGASIEQAVATLRRNEAYMDSLKARKTRLEAGMVSIDPRNGNVKAWVGGRDLKFDRYDKVAIARRQPGSTFKPFVYTAAIDNGYPPSYMLPDSAFTYRDPQTGAVWQPGNFGETTGSMLSLREALAMSNNLITARIITQLVNPNQVAFYARRMGIDSPLEEFPALGLGTSDVTLLELTSAYGTLASGGLHYDPTVVTRIEDRYGNILYEATPAPEEAISEQTAYTVVDMMRGVVHHSAGTGSRIRWQYGLGDYDIAAKTGTTQNNADGWFVMMHPELVTGAWVGFNDRRIAFRTNWWGQGAHNALFLVGSFFRSAVNSPDIQISKERFPAPEEFGMRELPAPAEERERERDRGGRVGW